MGSHQAALSPPSQPPTWAAQGEVRWWAASLPAAAAKEHLVSNLPLALVGHARGAGLGARAVCLDGPPAKARHGADAACDAPAAVAAKRLLRKRHAAGGAGVWPRGVRLGRLGCRLLLLWLQGGYGRKTAAGGGSSWKKKPVSAGESSC